MHDLIESKHTRTHTHTTEVIILISNLTDKKTKAQGG